MLRSNMTRRPGSGDHGQAMHSAALMQQGSALPSPVTKTLAPDSRVTSRPMSPHAQGRARLCRSRHRRSCCRVRAWTRRVRSRVTRGTSDRLPRCAFLWRVRALFWRRNFREVRSRALSSHTFLLTFVTQGSAGGCSRLSGPPPPDDPFLPRVHFQRFVRLTLNPQHSVNPQPLNPKPLTLTLNPKP